MNRDLLAILIFSLLGGSPTLGQQTDPPPKEIPNFAKGFELLSGLGLPDTGKARLVRFPDNEPVDRHRRGLDPDPLANSAWLVPKPVPEARQHLIVGQLNDVVALSAEAYEEQLAEARERYGEYAGSALQNQWRDTGWEDSSIDETVTALLDYLSKTKSIIESNEADMGQWLAQQVPLAQIVLFAAHLWKRGMTKEADRLAHAALKFGDDPAKTLDRVISLLARRSLEEVTDRFKADRHWTRYAQGLADLLARFPRGWDLFDAAQRLQVLVQRRADAPVPVDLTLFRQPFPEGAAQLLRAICDASEPVTMPSMEDAETDLTTSLWTLHPPKDIDVPLEELVAKGVDGVMMLAALIGDSAMTSRFATGSETQRRVFYPGSVFDTYDTFTGNSDLSESFRLIPRPLTRSELATIYLSPVVPQALLDAAQHQWDAPLQSFLFAWCRELRGKPDHALALSYLEKGGYEQQSAALDFLKEVQDASVVDQVEKVILSLIDNEEKWHSALTLLQLYIEQKGDAATGLFQTFEGKLTPLLEAKINVSEEDYEKQQIEAQQAELLKIKGLLEGNALELLLAQVQPGRPDDPWPAGLMNIYDYLSRGSDDGARDAVQLIEGIAKKEDGLLRETLLGLSFMAFSRIDWDEVQEDASGASKETAPLHDLRQGLLQPSLKPAWEKLLADTTPVSSQWESIAKTRGGLAAMLLVCTRFIPEDFQNATLAIPLLGDDPDAALEAKAEAYLRGDPPKDDSKWPRASRVEETRRAEIVESLKAFTDADAGAWIESLSADEKLFVQLELPRLDPPPETWLSLVQRVEAVDFAVEDVGRNYDWPSLQGRRLTVDLFKQLIESLRTGLDPRSDVYVRITSRGFGRGLAIEALPVEDEANANSWRSYLEHSRFDGHLRMIVGDLRSQPVLCVWSTDAEEPVEGDLTRFMERYRTSVTQSDFTLQIRVLPREAAPESEQEAPAVEVSEPPSE